MAERPETSLRYAALLVSGALAAAALAAGPSAQAAGPVTTVTGDPPPAEDCTAPARADGCSLMLTTPVVRGEPRQGKQLRARLALPDVEGLQVTYRWRAGKRTLGSRTDRVRLHRQAVGRRVRVTVTVSAPGYERVRATSRPTERVRPRRR